MIIITIFLFGILLGSFYNVCIYRIPQEQSIVFPPSHCTVCNHHLSWLDLLPVVSYLLLKGKCRYCGDKILIKYPIVEVLTGIMLTLLYLKYGLNWPLLVYGVLISILIITTLIDIEHQIIPDGLVITGIIAGAIFILSGISVPWRDGLIGLAIGGGSFLLVAFLSELILKKEGMGGGDIKLMGMIGLLIGWQLTLLAILLSIYVGGIIGGTLLLTRIKKRGEHIPFGPFIAFGTVIALFYGNDIINWYLYRVLGL